MENEKQDSTIIVVTHSMNRCHARVPNARLAQLTEDGKLKPLVHDKSAPPPRSHFQQYVADSLNTFRTLWRTCGVIV